MSPTDVKAALAAAMSGVLLLGGCATVKPPARAPAVAAAPPKPRPPPKAVVVKVPVPVKTDCLPKAFPRAPSYPDTDAALLAAGGAADRYQLMAAGRILRDKRLAELEKVVDGCR
jgi:hypothetical protein